MRCSCSCLGRLKCGREYPQTYGTAAECRSGMEVQLEVAVGGCGDKYLEYVPSFKAGNPQEKCCKRANNAMRAPFFKTKGDPKGKRARATCGS